VYSPRFIYVFQQLKTSFLLCLIERVVSSPVLPVAWDSLSSTAFYIFGSLELVPWCCNNIYSNSVIFEVRNVVTSLLGLVIVSHLSPKGSGRFRFGHGGGLTPSGITVKVRTCEERKKSSI
jgi:hypothetical protein